MTTDEVIVRIKRHPRFKDLGFVQEARVPIVASWIAFAIKGLRTGIKKEKVLVIVKRHRVNKEFNGIPMDIIANWIKSGKQLELI